MTLDNRGRKKGMPKVGGAKKGSIQTHSNEVKSAVLRVFNEVNKDDTYLKTLAVEDQRLFLSLLAKLLPSAVDVAVNHHVFDLGSAMLDASARADALPNPTPTVIDVKPQPVAVPETYQPLTVFDGKEDEPQPEQEVWEGY
jgi:hypothetical protein